MRLPRGVRRLFRLDVRRKEFIRDALDEELRFHLDARIAQLLDRGLSPTAARDEAMRRLGSSVDPSHNPVHRSAQRKEQRMAFRESIDGVIQDVRYAARGLAKRPAFTLVAVMTLAIGIGANTAIFSAVNAVLLRTLPYRDPAQLTDIVLTAPKGVEFPWSWQKFEVFRDASRNYSSMALHLTQQATLSGPNPERAPIEWVSAAYLHTLGVGVAMGHDFDADEDAGPNAPKRALISDALWQRRFSADPAVVGKTVRIDGDDCEVIGVLPPTFRGLSGTAEALLPIGAGDSASMTQPWSLEYDLVGRLKPGVTAAQATAEAARAGTLAFDRYPFTKDMLTTADAAKWSATARSLNSVRAAPVVQRSLLVLFAAVGMVLLIACVNLANLLLGRAATRRQEIGVRLAIGAGRGRLVRLLLAESLLLAAIGGVASVTLAWWGVHLLQHLNPADALQAQGIGPGIAGSGFDAIRLDPVALGFTFAVTLVAGVWFGLVPALQATRPSLTDHLRDSGAGRMSARLGATRRALVIAEVALALVLLAGSGLMLRSLGRLMAVNPGFTSDHILTIRTAFPPGALSPDSLPGFYERLQARLAAVPGVTGVALADCPPLNGGCNGTIMTFPDRPQSVTGNAMIGVHWVSPNWFGALHVPLIRGRMFAPGDAAGAPRVVLINEAAAKQYFPHEDPIGKAVKIYQGGFDKGATVIGIVGDVRFGTIDSVARPDSYISTGQSHVERLVIFLRTSVDPASVSSAARRAIAEIAPGNPVYDIRTMAARVGNATAQARFSALLLAIFAAVALALAVMGIYGVMSFGVVQRTREIGIRMALGAERGSVVGMVMAEGARLAGVGGVIGVAAALALTRVLRSLLYDVAPSDPATYAGVVLVVAAAVVVASWIPARRAASVEPTEALRS
ncbi:MAG TPA: ABC transporter permease [Gemmatimonadales bacterium]